MDQQGPHFNQMRFKVAKFLFQIYFHCREKITSHLPVFKASTRSDIAFIAQILLGKASHMARPNFTLGREHQANY
jgi:hypothetical protein